MSSLKKIKPWDIRMMNGYENKKLKNVLETPKDSVILNSIRTHIIVIDSNGNIVSSNSAWEKFIQKFEGVNYGSKNYWEIVETIFTHSELIEALRTATKDILNNIESYFYLDCPIQLNDQTVWYSLRINQVEGMPYVIIHQNNITDRKSIEIRIKESEDNYRTLFENISNGILIVSPDDHILLSNPSIEKMTGYTAKELEAMKFSDLLIENKELEPLRESLQKRKIEIIDVYETVIRKKDGLISWISITETPYLNSRNEFLGTMAVISDINENKQLENAQKIALKFALKASEDNVDIFDLAQFLREQLNEYINMDNFLMAKKIGDNKIKFLYLENEHFIGDTKENIRENGNGLIEYIIQTGKSMLLDEKSLKDVVNNENLTWNGKWAKSWIGVPIVANGETNGVMICQSYDSTIHYSKIHFQMLSLLGRQIGLLMQKLITNEERNNIFNLSRDLICVINQEGYYNYVNPSFCRVLGYTQEEFMKKSLNFYIKSDKLYRKILWNIRKLESGKSIDDIVLNLKHKNGEDRIISWSAVSDLSNGVFYCIGRNITDQRRSEIEAQKIRAAFTDRLEIMVAERTLELENAKMELTESLLKEKELSELKSRFVSTVSHQFRTPLSVIQTSMGILSMRINEMPNEFIPKFESTYNRIKDQIVRMTDLMNDVLILGKINTGNIIVNNSPIDIVKLCNDIANNFKEIHYPRTINLQTEGSQYYVNIDVKLIEHALYNLLSNALKYSPPTSEVNIKLIFMDEKVELIIQDEGIGIPETDLQHLFEPFYRASNVKDISGTGLGTAIAKEYVELVGGNICVKSVCNQGTEFIISFPKE